MSTQKTITIDGVAYVRADSIARPAGDLKIAVLDRGFVYIGICRIDGDFLRIEGAKNIRAWGTTRGLGELVAGPTPKTVIDDVGSIAAPMRAVISLIDVREGSKWTDF